MIVRSRRKKNRRKRNRSHGTRRAQLRYSSEKGPGADRQKAEGKEKDSNRTQSAIARVVLKRPYINFFIPGKCAPVTKEVNGNQKMGQSWERKKASENASGRDTDELPPQTEKVTRKTGINRSSDITEA